MSVTHFVTGSGTEMGIKAMEEWERIIPVIQKIRVDV